MQRQSEFIARTTRAMIAFVCLTLVAGCSGGKESPEVTFERGRLLADRGEHEDAIPLYNEALKGTPERAVVYYERGRSYEELGVDKPELLDRAVEDYTTCLEKDPEFLQALNNKGVVLAKMGKFLEAAEEFGQLISLQPDDVLALRNRGLCHHDRGDFDSALADYNKALSYEATDTDTLFQRGNVYLEQTKYTEAIADYDKAIELAPTYAKAWMNRGVARYGLNQREAALKDLEQAQKLDDSIVLPGIDWLTAGSSDAPSTNITVSRPIYLEAAAGGDWTEMLSVVQTTLQENGFDNIKLQSSLPELFCGRFSGDVDGKSIVIYFGMLNAETSDVSLPAGSREIIEPNRALLVLSRPAADAEFSVARFVKEWMPVPVEVAPKVISVKVPAE